VGNPHPHIENLKPFKEGEDKRRKGNGRKPVKFLTALLTKELAGKKEIQIEGFDIETGKKTKIRIPVPTKETIVQALLRQGAKGNMIAIKEIFYRMEGNMPMPITGEDGERLFDSPILSDNQFELLLNKLNGKAKTTDSK
jgi:hypothetical protein